MVERWRRDDGVEFVLKEIEKDKYYIIQMYIDTEGRKVPYGTYTTKEEALKDFNKIVKEG